MKKIMVVFGTRPEAIKMCPLVQELGRRKNFKTVVCVTGQHREMLDQVLTAFRISADYDLEIMMQNQTLFDITAKTLSGMKAVLEKEMPDLVLVHGDTSTAFAAALACFYLHIPVGHVEAGLRTYDADSPYPEEFNRQAIGIVSKYHFAPTEVSRSNLIREGKDPNSVFVTGNTVIDALMTTVTDRYTHPDLEWAKGSRLIIITAHRRENIGRPLQNIFRAVRRIAEAFEDVKVIYPVHMNPQVQELAQRTLDGQDRIRLIEPLNVVDFHNFMARAYLILTDSGGIQEEAPSLGKPVLVMRQHTERPEGLEAGTSILTGTEEKDIFIQCSRLLSDPAAYAQISGRVNPYGDGHTSERICDIINATL